MNTQQLARSLRGEGAAARLFCALVALAAFGLSAAPVFSADSGIVNAQVNAGAQACITVTPSGAGQNVNFGTLPFSAPGNSFVNTGTPNITVTNCGTTTQALLASGTNATGPMASWTLTDGVVCNTLGEQNRYKLGLGVGSNEVFLTTTNQALGPMPSDPLSLTPKIVMPCTGSQGSGQTMTMSYLFTATA